MDAYSKLFLSKFCNCNSETRPVYLDLGGWCNWQTQRLLISRVEDSNSSPLTNANGQRHKHWGVQMDPVSESASGAKPSGRSSAGCPCPTENFDAAPRNVAFAFPRKRKARGELRTEPLIARNAKRYFRSEHLGLVSSTLNRATTVTAGGLLQVEPGSRNPIKA